MKFTLEAGPADLDDMATTFTKAMAADLFWTTMKGPLSFGEKLDFQRMNLWSRVNTGLELGVCRTFKVIDDNGKMVAWSGLGIPISLSAEQHEALKSKYAFPSGGNKKLQEFFQVNIIQGLFDQGYDPTKHYQRQTIMVLPEYHGMGLGTMLTEKINSVADEAGGIIYARARLGAAALFYREGYEGLKKVAYDLKDFGVDDEGGKLKTKTAVFIFKRQPGAKSDRGRKLDLDFEKE